MSTSLLLFNPLKEKISQKEAKIGIIGLGYVGLPTLVHYADKGFKAVGFDLDKTKIKSLRHNFSYINDVSDNDLIRLSKQGLIEATDDLSRLSEVDVVFVCVPTPIDKYKQPNLNYVKSASESISQHITKNTLIVFESTTYPGTTEEIFKPALEEKGFIIGEDVFLAYSPERVDPGNQNYNLDNTPKVVGGLTETCTDLAALVIGNNAYKVSSIKAAEMAKVYENSFRWINIAFANEMAMISQKMGIEINEVIDACATKPYGFMPFYPGPGVGGHCIPVDPYYLTYKAKEYGETTRMIELSGEINNKMPYEVVNRVQTILNDKRKSLKGSKLVVLGVAYKPNIGDVRESPILPLIKLLEEKDAQVTIVDENVKQFTYENNIYETKALNKELVKDADLIIVGTNHDSFDYDKIKTWSNLILDTRNVVQNDESCEVYYL
jgi:UDP-N-acetyl-D-glucosamine dehydrogenase